MLFRATFVTTFLIAMTASAAVSQAGTIISAQDRGWFRDDGLHNVSNKNTITGQDGAGTSVFNSFFVFNTGTLAGSVATSVDLRLELEEYFGPDASETFDVYDVSTTAAALATNHSIGSATGLGIYADLGSGSVYATKSASSGDVGSILTVSLSSQAVSDLNTAIGGGTEFIVGLSLRSPFTLASGDEALRFSSSTENRTHQLDVTTTSGAVPEPMSLAIFGAIGLAGVGIRRRREN